MANWILSYYDFRYPPTVPGSRLIACAGCEIDLWFAPEAARRIRQEGYWPICRFCYEKAKEPARKRDQN